MRSDLTEGMRKGDLEDMVLPMISVDEYASKISNKAVVIGFYVQDIAAAQDLNRFIQKSALDLLDTEVSPAPDQRGYYIVFVEIMLNRAFGSLLGKLLDEVSPLCGIEKWQMKVRHHRAIMDFSNQGVQKAVAKARGPLEEAAVADFLAQSELPPSRIEGKRLMIGEGAGASEFIIECFGVGATDSFRTQPIEASFEKVADTRRLLQLLGDHWVIDPVDGRFLVTNHFDARGLVLKPIRR